MSDTLSCRYCSRVATFAVAARPHDETGGDPVAVCDSHAYPPIGASKVRLPSSGHLNAILQEKAAAEAWDRRPPPAGVAHIHDSYIFDSNNPEHMRYVEESFKTIDTGRLPRFEFTMVDEVIKRVALITGIPIEFLKPPSRETRSAMVAAHLGKNAEQPTLAKFAMVGTQTGRISFDHENRSNLPREDRRDHYRRIWEEWNREGRQEEHAPTSARLLLVSRFHPSMLSSPMGVDIRAVTYEVACSWLRPQSDIKEVQCHLPLDMCKVLGDILRFDLKPADEPLEIVSTDRLLLVEPNGALFRFWSLTCLSPATHPITHKRIWTW